jgi:hypothetical protein
MPYDTIVWAFFLSLSLSLSQPSLTNIYLSIPFASSTPRVDLCSNNHVPCRSSLCNLGLLGEVAEAVRQGDIGNAQAGSLEGAEQRLGSVGVLDVSARHIGVDQRDDATESLSGGQAGVAADGGDRLGEGVEVLLGLDEGGGGGEDLGVVAELGDDLVGKFELGTCAGTSEKDTRGLAGQSTGGTRGAKVRESLDERENETLLAETGLGHGRKGDENE